MPIDVVGLAQELIRIPSINPMGRNLTGPEYLERRLTDFLEQRIGELNLPCERHTVLPGRDNLLTRVEGRGSMRDRLILLEVHQDTVPVDGMTIPPFDGRLEDGKVWGRGACDVKGGLATLLANMVLLSESTAKDLPTVVMAMTINEEYGFDGVADLCELWKPGKSKLLPRAPDCAIVTEPTELNVVVAHKGCVRWNATATGIAAHSSNPTIGVNAIYCMAKLVSSLEAYAQEHLPLLEHPLVGVPTLSVGTIQGGISVNTVPDYCLIEIDRRVLPDESPIEARQHVIEYLEAEAITDGIDHLPPWLCASGLSSDNNQPLADQLTKACRQITQSNETGVQRGVPFGTDAGTLSGAGVPTVVFGPGSIEQAHTKDEWIDAAMLETAVKILHQFCTLPLPETA